MHEGLFEAIGNLRSDIQSVSIVSSGKVLQAWSRDDNPALASDDMRRMVLQVDVFSSMPATNEKLYGKVRFLVISHEKVNALLIPFGADATLVVAFLKRHNHEELLEKNLCIVER